MQRLTKRQEDILLWCASYLVRHDRFPSNRAIGGAFGIRSTNGVFTHIAVLEDKGYLEVAVEFDTHAMMKFSDAGWAYVEGVEMFGSAAKGSEK